MIALRSGEENKNPDNLEVTALKQVNKNLLPDKFSENPFFLLSCIGIDDRYSKSLLSIIVRENRAGPKDRCRAFTFIF